jgi:hypothetical protein
MTDELRNQIRKLDPMHPDVPTTPPTRTRLEDIMASTTTPTPTPTRTPDTGSGRSRWYIAAAAAVAVAAAISLPALVGGSPGTSVAGPPLELSLGEGPGLASCLPFDTAILAGMPMAFEGTVTSVDGEQVTLTVDRWFRGGDAGTVELHAPAGMEALIGGIAFAEGEQYLVSATDGNVNYCGYTDASTPELRTAFEQAFPG